MRYVGELNRLVRLDKKPDFPRFLQEVRVRKRSRTKPSTEAWGSAWKRFCTWLQHQKNMVTGS